MIGAQRVKQRGLGVRGRELYRRAQQYEQRQRACAKALREKKCGLLKELK